MIFEGLSQPKPFDESMLLPYIRGFAFMVVQPAPSALGLEFGRVARCCWVILPYPLGLCVSSIYILA